MKIRAAIAALGLGLAMLPGAALASRPDVRLSALDRADEDRAAQQLAIELTAAIAASDFAVTLPQGYLVPDPGYDPLAGWSPD